MGRKERSNTKVNGQDVGEEEGSERRAQEAELMFCAERWLQKGGILVVIGDVEVGVELYEVCVCGGQAMELRYASLIAGCRSMMQEETTRLNTTNRTTIQDEAVRQRCRSRILEKLWTRS
jgi:hypothetical protein